MSQFNAKAYLQLLGVSDSGKADHQLLLQLQAAHLHRVPFENLDIHLGVPIVLERDHVFRKIVLAGRGGFCYELNGLFFHLLQYLGYECWLISARVYEAPKKYSPPFDHMAILVRLKDKLYLVDVGFGDFSSKPIQIDLARETKDSERVFEVDLFYSYHRIQIRQGQNRTPEYIFQLKPYNWHDFQPRSLFHQSNPKSHFQKGPVITQLTPAGRITLTDRKLLINGEAMPIDGQTDFERLLDRHFAINWKMLKRT